MTASYRSLAASAAAGIAYPDVETKPDDEVYSMLFPGRGERESVYEQPDWARVHRELARVGVTLRILHGEYADECAAAPQFAARGNQLEIGESVAAVNRADMRVAPARRQSLRGRTIGA